MHASAEAWASDNGVTLQWIPGNGSLLQGTLQASNGGSTTWYVLGSSTCTHHLAWGIQDANGVRLRVIEGRYRDCTDDLATKSFVPGQVREASVQWDGTAWDDGMTERVRVPAGNYTLVATVSGDDDPPVDFRIDVRTVVELRVPVRLG